MKCHKLCEKHTFGKDEQLLQLQGLPSGTELVWYSRQPHIDVFLLQAVHGTVAIDGAASGGQTQLMNEASRMVTVTVTMAMTIDVGGSVSEL